MGGLPGDWHLSILLWPLRKLFVLCCSAHSAVVVGGWPRSLLWPPGWGDSLCRRRRAPCCYTLLLNLLRPNLLTGRGRNVALYVEAACQGLYSSAVVYSKHCLFSY